MSISKNKRQKLNEEEQKDSDMSHILNLPYKQWKYELPKFFNPEINCKSRFKAL